MKPRQSILNLHYSFAVAVLLILIIFISISIKSNAVNYLAAKEARIANSVAENLFEAVRHYGFERGRVNVVLNYKGNMLDMDKNIEFYLEHRRAGDSSMNEALAKASQKSGLITPEWEKVVSHINSKVVLLRKEAEELIRLPYDQRDKEFAQLWFDTMSEYIETIQKLSTAVFRQLDRLDKTGKNLFTLSRNTIELRDNAGPVCSYIAAAILSPEGFTEARKDEILIRRTLADKNYDSIVNSASVLGNSKVNDALSMVSDIYFTELRRMANIALISLRKGEDPPYSQRDFTRVAVSGLESIARLMETASIESAEYFRKNEKDAFIYLAGSVLMLILATIFIFYSFRVVNAEIYNPIRDITEKLNQLSDGNTDVGEISAGDRNDEISDIYRAMEVFRQNQIVLAELTSSLEEKVTEEVERRSQAELMMVQHSKMAAMGEMIGIIAHQWKQPLNTIAVLAQTYDDEELFEEMSSEERAESASQIIEQVQFMASTVDTFRNFFKPSSVYEKFNVYDAFEKLIYLVRNQFVKYDIELVHEEPPFPLIMEGFENEFIHGAMNILMNARDELIRYKDREKRITIRYSQSGDEINIHIIDTGMGIPEDVLPKVYEQYFTTKGEFGTGIGLYMTKTIVEKRLGGRITLNTGSEGTEFILSFQSMDA
ncbi:sensor histidine kinase [Limisalsivibrio acetivorans]|uniref:sensor histidine kinase n=1 Tax=Limisalsivibrio acetivorans TaxID=1304888 RepID=UPI0003B44A08|nr:HAMP domain-containing sensor histidine kinase [Limisalsivibrio acetivorans]